MIPPFRDSLARPLHTVQQPSLAWGYTQGNNQAQTRLSGFVDGQEAYRQFVHACFHTERFSVPFMEDNHGSQFKQFIGRSFSYLRAKIYNVVKDALFQDSRTRAVRVISVTEPQPRVAHVRIEVQSIFGRVVHGFNVPLA